MADNNNQVVVVEQIRKLDPSFNSEGYILWMESIIDIFVYIMDYGADLGFSWFSNHEPEFVWGSANSFRNRSAFGDYLIELDDYSFKTPLGTLKFIGSHEHPNGDAELRLREHLIQKFDIQPEEGGRWFKWNRDVDGELFSEFPRVEKTNVESKVVVEEMELILLPVLTKYLECKYKIKRRLQINQQVASATEPSSIFVLAYRVNLSGSCVSTDFVPTMSSSIIAL